MRQTTLSCFNGIEAGREICELQQWHTHLMLGMLSHTRLTMGMELFAAQIKRKTQPDHEGVLSVKAFHAIMERCRKAVRTFHVHGSLSNDRSFIVKVKGCWDAEEASYLALITLSAIDSTASIAEIHEI
ncbi:MAG: hypothetical protein HYX66_08820 [Ignavibacteria bacterium]|nr:hypothetical protein [Ignavibacteria bacterium]